MESSGYRRANDLAALCQRTGMPPEVTGKITELAQTYDFRPLTDAVDLLFDCATGMEGVRTLKKRIGDREDASFIMLAAHLGAALRTREMYAARGIGDDVYYDTMGCFSRFVREHRESFGVYGFDRAFWTYRQIAMSLFRLGTLEYEMTAYRGPDVTAEGLTLRQNENILSVHIPSDAKLSGENCHDSYRAAESFFAKFYPGYSYRYFYTSTWLLSPRLVPLLHEGSGIINFQKDYTLCAVDEKSEGYKVWVFKNSNLIPEDFPENTSLQRSIKDHVLKGGSIGTAAGFFQLKVKN